MNKFLKDIEFDNEYINSCITKVDNKLKEYINNKILPEYDLNDEGHNKNHIEFVLKRALELSKNYDINYNILYVSVSFHDIACHINREEHEVLSANIAYKDEFLNKFFNKEELTIIKEAIEDHRASSDKIPRNIYGKILSSADRKVDIKTYLISSLFFQVTDISNLDMNEAIEQSYNHAIKKFGKNGYATNKFYVDDKRYKEFLTNLQYLIDNKDEFYKLAEIVFNEVKSNKKN
ncbi:MAG: hypothetical protein IJE04_02035 [Bacilli bacterium]|nr:hypothetical protein [Bacilli bacterium]